MRSNASKYYQRRERARGADGFGFVQSQSITKRSQAFAPSVRSGQQYRGLNPRQKGSRRSQGGFTRHCVIRALISVSLTLESLRILHHGLLSHVPPLEISF
ncbi:hypothetical protein PoB_003711000 [Plakobranchus ocellatus]|uniref:Uncharacterized protein n=1 Tax=Plakobranchus ocellatus TaxID=259542 RepID=A0AAV4AUN1_9GAST|nr:hypothetical protein PoB_003711000 [Plakobranchus ocellatus]